MTGVDVHGPARAMYVDVAASGLLSSSSPRAMSRPDASRSPVPRPEGPPGDAGRRPGDERALPPATLYPGTTGLTAPTVVVRRGTSQGSGTIIASVDGETLVLTAAHVVKAEGPVLVELHRYNLGWSDSRRRQAHGRA